MKRPSEEIYEEVKELMDQAGVDDTDLWWYADVIDVTGLASVEVPEPPNWLSPKDKERFVRVRDLLNTKVRISQDRERQIFNLVFSHCVCGKFLQGYHANRMVAVNYKGACPHLDMIEHVLYAVWMRETNQDTSPFWPDYEFPEKLLTQLKERGFIQGKGPKWILKPKGEVFFRLIRLIRHGDSDPLAHLLSESYLIQALRDLLKELSKEE